jgi:hypothetical protein
MHTDISTISTTSPSLNQAFPRHDLTHGLTLIETIIASSIFVIFVAAALSASVAATNQERLNDRSMELVSDVGNLKSLLSEEFSRAAFFEEYFEIKDGVEFRKGTGTILYPGPPAPSLINDPIMYRPTDDANTVYQFEYIKLRSHQNIADNPNDLLPYHKDIHRTDLTDDTDGPLVGTDGQPLSLVSYINANPTPFMLYDPNASGSQWWVRPVWETNQVKQTLAENSNPDNLRHYFLLLKPADGVTWTNMTTDVTTPIELGHLTRAYTNPGNTTPVQIGPPIATNIDRRTFKITVLPNAISLHCRIYRSINISGSGHAISRSVDLSVALPQLPSTK